MRKYRLENYERERTRLRASNKRIKQARKAFILSQKDKPCADCGIKYPPYVMDFDHLDEKIFNISSGYNTISWQKLKDEIAKCEVVCSNCHRERTQQRLDYEKAKNSLLD